MVPLIPTNHNRSYRLLSYTFTSLNGLAGLIGIYSAIIGDEYWPLRFIIFGAVFDFLDGYFGKKAQLHSRIGMYSDSVADAITYVLLPSFILLFMGQNRQPNSTTIDLIFIGIALFYLFCGSYRLIRFTKKPTSIYFEGLPASIAALVVGSLSVLIMTTPREMEFLFDKGILSGLFFIGISFLMITQFKYPSHISYSKIYKIMRVIGYTVIGVFVTFSNFWIGLGVFLFFLYYTLAGPVYMRTVDLDS